MNPTLRQRIVIYTLLILCGWSLALFYGYLGKTLEPAWLPIALLHTLVAALVWRFGTHLRPPVTAGWIAYAPAVAILFGSALAALGTRLLFGGSESTSRGFDPQILAFVLWIPLVEEIIFRQGVGGVLRKHLGLFWGAYGSALLFALAHGTASWGRLSVPIGPLLLGLCCEWVYAKSGRLTAAIALHAACNASGSIFSALDHRWLDWLQALYLKA